MIQAAFLRAITRPDSNKGYEPMKIPERTKETPRELTWILPNKVQLVICDGSLFTTFNHSHIPEAMRRYYDLDTAVVIIEDTSLKGCSRSASLLRSCSDDFRRYYDQLKDVKKKCGKVYMKFGDDSLKFGHVIFAIMPSLGKQSLNRHRSEHTTFLGFLSQCCRNLLKKSESSGIKHLCLPVFIEGII